MVKTVIIRKRTIFIYGLLVLVLAIGVVVLETFINKSNNDEYITYAQAAKMIAYANVDDTQAFETGEVWYKPYIEYVNINGYMQCEEPDDYIMMKDVYILSKKLNAGDTTFESIGIQSLSQLNNNNRAGRRLRELNLELLEHLRSLMLVSGKCIQLRESIYLTE